MNSYILPPHLDTSPNRRKIRRNVHNQPFEEKITPDHFWNKRFVLRFESRF